MVQYYNLFGAKVGSHYLAMGVLAALFGGTSMAIGGGSKKATQTPPLNAASPDEADFIKYIHPGPALLTGSRNIWVNTDIMAGNSWMRQRRALRKRSIRRHWTYGREHGPRIMKKLSRLGQLYKYRQDENQGN